MRKRVAKDQSDVGGDAGPLSASLVRGLDVLRAFRPGDRPLGNQDIIARTGLPKATVSRITHTLCALGYLLYDEDFGRYSPGPAMVALGYSALASTAVIHVAKPLMQELADSTGAAVALGTRDGLEMIYLSNCRSRSPVSLMLDPGSHLPIWKTAMGLAYAVGLHDDERAALVARLQAAEADFAADIAAAFKRAMEEHARCGYVTSFGDWHSYVRAVGVPFRPVDGTSPVAITCGGTIEIITDERAHSEIGPRLVALAGTLKAQLEGAIAEPLLVATRL